MKRTVTEANLNAVLQRERKVVINADLDGILTGMLLQKYLDWEVAGYSACNGTLQDELWLTDPDMPLEDAVFTDLPVCLDGVAVIDQHFVALDNTTVMNYRADQNKINPNIMRGYAYRMPDGTGKYFNKYPYNTMQIVLAGLENIGAVGDADIMDLGKVIGRYDVADLVLRADGIIRNMVKYGPNCRDWGVWLEDIGGYNTAGLLCIVYEEAGSRLDRYGYVEERLRSFGCEGGDGGCSGLFHAGYDAQHNERARDNLKRYFSFLEEAVGVMAPHLPEMSPYMRLRGYKLNGLSVDTVDRIREGLNDGNLFSYAITYRNTVSKTVRL